MHHFSPSSSDVVPAGPQWPACRRRQADQSGGDVSEK